MPLDISHESELLKAIYAGDEDAVSKLITAENINRSGINGFTPLMLAIYRGHMALANRVLNTYHADINAISNLGLSALLLNIHLKNWAGTEWLLTRRANVNIQDKNGFSAIFYAVCQENEPLVDRLLLESETNLYLRETSGTTILHWACRFTNLKILQKLLLKYENIHTVDSLGRTPLHVVSSYRGDRKPVIKMLLQCGANIHAVDHEGRTPFFHAIISKNLENLKFLLLYDRTCLLKTLSTSKLNALHYVAICGNKAILDYLLEQGFSIDSRDILGYTPLMWAALRNNVVMVHELLTLGADLNAVDYKGRTALMKVAEGGQSLMTNTLIQLTSFEDLNKKSLEGLNVFDYAHKIPQATKHLLAQHPRSSPQYRAIIESWQKDRKPLLDLIRSRHRLISFVNAYPEVLKYRRSIELRNFLICSILTGNSKLLAAFISTVAEKTHFHLKDCHGNNALIYAVLMAISPKLSESRREAAIQNLNLILKSFDPAQLIYNNKGKTALMMAAAAKSEPVTQILMNYATREYILAKDQDGFTALQYAVGKKCIMQNLLTKHHQELLFTQDNNGVTPLILAAGLGKKTCVEYLLTLGWVHEQCAVTDTDGNTAEMYALNNGHLDIVDIIKRKREESAPFVSIDPEAGLDLSALGSLPSATPLLLSIPMPVAAPVIAPRVAPAYLTASLPLLAAASSVASAATITPALVLPPMPPAGPRACLAPVPISLDNLTAREEEPGKHKKKDVPKKGVNKTQTKAKLPLVDFGTTLLRWNSSSSEIEMNYTNKLFDGFREEIRKDKAKAKAALRKVRPFKRTPEALTIGEMVEMCNAYGMCFEHNDAYTKLYTQYKNATSSSEQIRLAEAMERVWRKNSEEYARETGYPDLSQDEKDRRTFLRAVSSGDILRVKALLELGFPRTFHPDEQPTPDDDLFGKTFDWRTHGKLKYSALMIAAVSGYTKIARILLNQSTFIVRDQSFGRNKVDWSDYKAQWMLLDRSWNGKTALMLAIENGRLGVVSEIMLSAAKQDVVSQLLAMKDNKGFTAFYYAADDKEMHELLTLASTIAQNGSSACVGAADPETHSKKRTRGATESSQSIASCAAPAPAPAPASTDVPTAPTAVVVPAAVATLEALPFPYAYATSASAAAATSSASAVAASISASAGASDLTFCACSTSCCCATISYERFCELEAISEGSTVKKLKR